MNNNPKETKEVKIKPIKLIVKKPTSARRKNTKTNEQEVNKIAREQQIIELFSSLKILLLIVLLIFIIALIINIVKEQKNTPIENTDTQINVGNNGLFSKWQTTNGYTFTFEKNNLFHIYESGLYVNNNYYEGTYNYKENNDAIVEMGYNEDEFKNSFNIETYLNIYSIHMTPTKYMKNGINIINRKIEPSEEWWFILILLDNNKAIAYNKTLDIRYQLLRN